MITLYIENPQLLFLIPIAFIILLFLTFITFVKFKDKLEKSKYTKGRRWKRIIIFLLRFMMMASLIIALSSPFILESKTVKTDPRLKILTDESKSMDVFDLSFMAGMKERLSQEVPVVEIGSVARDSSAIGDFVLRNIEGSDNILLISDGNNNQRHVLEDVIALASKLNATVNTLNIKPLKSDAWVKINAPSRASAGTPAEFNVVVKQINTLEPYELSVKLDNQDFATLQLDGKTEEKITPFSKVLEEGYHVIEARITSKDFYPENNVYYAVIKVEEKPNILFLSKSVGNPVLALLKEIYNVDERSSLPGDLSKYGAILISNEQASDLPPIDKLTNYVLDGNGLFMIGGPAAYDRGGYKNSIIETLLPVNTGMGKPSEKKETNIVIVIDISGSSGQAFSSTSENTVRDVETALALRMIEDLTNNTNVGVVAFNTKAYIVAPLAPKNQQIDLTDKIASLQYGGGTLIDQGIDRAIELLGSTSGSKNIILISDGNSQLRGDARASVRGAIDMNIRVYTVGIGVQETDEKFMQELADLGNGDYFRPTEQESIKIVLKGTADLDKNASMKLEIRKSYHFITKGLTLKATVSGFNYVVPKSSAEVLVALANNQPILTVWRFGLGRVAALSTDAGSTWAPDLLAQRNSLLLARTINWVIGDPSRTKDFDVLPSQGRINEEIKVVVKSKTLPNQSGMVFTKIDETLYETVLNAKNPGFYDVLKAPIAINYPLEYEDLGVNPRLEGIISATNGKIFELNDAAGIVQMVREHSQHEEVKSSSLKWALLVFAICIFLLELIVRRIFEARR